MGLARTLKLKTILLITEQLQMIFEERQANIQKPEKQAKLLKVHLALPLLIAARMKPVGSREQAKNGNMPLELQKGSKFTVLLRDSKQAKNGNMPLELQKGSKFTVLLRDSIQAKKGNMPLELQKGSKFAVLAKDTTQHTAV